MARPKYQRRDIGLHPKYSDCSDKQKAVEDLVDSQFHSIMELVEVVVHKRLTQWGELMAEALQNETK